MGDAAADAMARCLAQGTDKQDCQDYVSGHTVNGAFCDGNVQMTKSDPNGPIVYTCIPEVQIQKKLGLEVVPTPAAPSATATSTTDEATSGKSLAALAALAVAAFVVAMVVRK